MNNHEKCLTGQIYVEELNLFTPMAPARDHVGADSKPYWGWANMGAFVSGVVNTLWDALEKRAREENIPTLGMPPDRPPYPVPALHVNGESMFSEQQLLDLANEIAARFLRYALPVINRGKQPGNAYRVPCGEMMGQGLTCCNTLYCDACVEISKLRDQVREFEGLKLFAQLQQIGKFAEALGEMRTLLTDKEADEMARTVARARLSAIVRDVTQTEIRTQDPKYVIIGGKLCNSVTKESIPDDEPIMIFRAKDKVALPVLEYYRAHYPYNDDHDKAIGVQILRFEDFACQKPERMKMPDT